MHYEAFSSPLDVIYYSARKYEYYKTYEDAASMWKFNLNPTCPVCRKELGKNFVFCDLCGGGVHYECIGTDFYQGHKSVKSFNKKTFICYHCMDNVKEFLEGHKDKLKINGSLKLIESTNWFFSYLRIDFTSENVQLFERILQHKQVDRRTSAVR